MRIVIAIGGNSLIRDANKISPKDQMEQVVDTCRMITEIVSEGHDLVITHGNGPQVGFLLRMSELSNKEIPLFPLDYCVANTQGSIGYQLQNALNNEFLRHAIQREVATITTQCVVEKNDPAFLHPTKPIGSFLSKEEMEKLSREGQWQYMEDSGRGYRRVVASPVPQRIIEKKVIELLLKNKTVVIAVGGGGIPVVEENQSFKGVEAVIDKDLASSLLAREIQADLFIITTAVPYAYIHFNQPDQKALERVNTKDIKSYLSQGFFGKGSMEPKILAATAFTEFSRNPSIITSPGNIIDAVSGKQGTHIIYE